MSKTKAVTHADLAPSRRRTDLGSKFGVFLIVFTILCGLACFVLCLLAEATRSEMTWIDIGDNVYECAYSGSGKMPLLCAAIAFVGLAIAMMIEHTFMLISVSKLPPSALDILDPDFGPSRTFTRQACFFFVTTWLCFAVGEILLLIGLSLESGHLKNWSIPRQSCVVTKQGIFSSAGVFSLVTVFFAAGLYLTSLKAQKICQDHQNFSQQILEAAALYVPSPPISPVGPRIAAVARENPIFSRDNDQPTSLVLPLSYSSKDNNLV